MGNRSKFPEGVRVGQTQLEFESTSKQSEILNRWTDGATMGIASGFAVTVNGTNATLIDVAAGVGYVPNGERVEATAATAGLSLSTYESGVDNFVCVVYTETTSRPEAHQTSGVTFPTRVGATYRTRVYTQEELDALDASNADMTVDATDRLMVVGVVNANGPGVALTTADLTNAPAAEIILGSTQPFDVTGVVIGSDIDPTTVQSVDATLNPLARLELQTGLTPPSTCALRYRAPGEAAFGVSQSLTAAPLGEVTEFTLVSFTGKTIVVRVLPDMLPRTVSTTFTDNLTISDIYRDEALRLSSRDDTLRHRLGSIAPDRQNSLGLGIVDIVEGIIEAFQGILLGTNLQTDSAKALTPRIVTQQSPFGGGSTLLWDIKLNATDRHIRFYVNQFQTLNVTVNARWDGALWNADDATQSASKFAVFSTGIACFAHSAAVSWDDSSWTATPLFLSGLGGIAGLGALLINGETTLGANILSAATRLAPRLRADYGAGGGGADVRTLLFYSQLDGAAGATTLRLYRSISSDLDADTLELTINAVWSGGVWNKDVGGTAASKIQYGKGFILLRQRLAATGGTWADTAWDAPTTTINLTLGTIVTNDYFAAGTTGFNAFSGTAEYRWQTIRTFRQSYPYPDFAIVNAAAYNSGFIGKTGSPSDMIVQMPLRFPNGATVTQFILWGNMQPNAGQNRLRVFRVARDAPQTQTELLSTATVLVGSTGAGAGAGTYTPDQNNLIDNINFTYYLQLESTTDAQADLSAVYATYTITQVVLS